MQQKHVCHASRLSPICAHECTAPCALEHPGATATVCRISYRYSNAQVRALRNSMRCIHLSHIYHAMPPALRSDRRPSASILLQRPTVTPSPIWARRPTTSGTRRSSSCASSSHRARHREPQCTEHYVWERVRQLTGHSVSRAISPKSTTLIWGGSAARRGRAAKLSSNARVLDSGQDALAGRRRRATHKCLLHHRLGLFQLLLL